MVWRAIPQAPSGAVPTKLMSESTESRSVPAPSGLPLGSKFEQIVAEQGMVVA
jgi:hypothetical protein